MYCDSSRRHSDVAAEVLTMAYAPVETLESLSEDTLTSYVRNKRCLSDLLIDVWALSATGRDFLLAPVLYCLPENQLSFLLPDKDRELRLWPEHLVYQPPRPPPRLRHQPRQRQSLQHPQPA